MFPEPIPDKIEEYKDWLLPRWAYSDEEWDKFTYEEIKQGYVVKYIIVPGFEVG